MVFTAVVDGESKEALEGEDVVSQEHTIVSLANGSNVKIMEGDAKTRALGSIELLIVVNSVQVSTGDSSLFDALLIVYGAKDLVIPFAEGLPVLEAVVEVQESIASCAEEVKFSD